MQQCIDKTIWINEWISKDIGVKEINRIIGMYVKL